MPKTATPRKPETVSRKLAETRNTSKSRSLSSLLGIGDNEKRLATDIGSGLNDVIGRGTIAGLLGLPGDLGGAAENGLRSLLGLPQVVPYGGSEHIGQKMEQAGLVSNVRRPKTELLASLISPAQAATAGYKAPQMARAGVQMMDNLASAPTMARIGQRGAVETNLGKMVAPQDEALRVAQGGDSATLSGMGNTPKPTRSEILARAKAIGISPVGKNDEILSKLSILERDPSTWSVDDFSKVADELDIHQDFRGSSQDPEALNSILSEGLRSGMSDNLGHMYSKKFYTYGKGLSGGRSFIFPSRSIKYVSDSNPRFAPGNKPLFYMDATEGQDIYEAFKTAKRNPNYKP